jgi:transcriptional regulator with XRE-family HTH domain
MGKRRLKLPPLVLASPETFGERLARLRKERGYTQVELAEKIGITQALMTDYERGKLRLNAEMICRLAQALDVSADVLLGISKSAAEPRASRGARLSLRLVRRIQKIDRLPAPKQKALLQTIDGFLRGVGAQA